MNLLFQIFSAVWELLLESSVYILFGLLIGGLLKAFLSPSYIAKHLGKGKYSSVLKAAFFGIPLPLCSCGVLPAAAALRKQGANNGATTAFLIATPESGVDSIVVSYALLDPIMTVARPIAAFITAVIAGLTENLRNPPEKSRMLIDHSCPIDNCCNGDNCPPDKHATHHSFREKIWAGCRFAYTELWPELAGWFFIGILFGGIITALVPDNLLSHYLGSGISAKLLMITVSIPLYICATASTPIAAALILKGVSPGTALVFLLAGPATNVTSLSVLTTILGKRATGLYLVNIAAISICCGLILDQLYIWNGITPTAIIGTAGELMPFWLQLVGVVVLLHLSIKPISNNLLKLIAKFWPKKSIPSIKTVCNCGNHCSDKITNHTDKHNKDHSILS